MKRRVRKNPFQKKEPVRDEIARNILVELNLDLIPWFLFHYELRPRRKIAALDIDSWGIAQMALMRMADLWRPELATFATYAVYWFRGLIQDAYDREKCYRKNLRPLSEARLLGAFSEAFEEVDSRIDASFILAPRLKSLSPRRRLAVELRYGIGDYTPRTFDEIGSLLGVTKERARQLVLSALRKMRDWIDPSAKQVEEILPRSCSEEVEKGSAEISRFWLNNPKQGCEE